MAARWIRRSHHGRHNHPWILRQCRFDLRRANPVATCGDHIIIAGHKLQISLRIHKAQIARDQIVANKALSGLFRLVPIA